MKEQQVILLVDDNIKNIELLEAHLSPLGYKTLAAASGQAALEMLSANPVDLILLDVLMPVMNGFEVAARIKNHPTWNTLPIVLVTSLHDTEDRIRGIEAGCDDFISKPVDKLELIARVRSLLKVKAYHDLMASYRQDLEAAVEGRTLELRKLTAALSESNAAIRRFVPEQFLKQLGKSCIEDVRLGDHAAMNMVIMFADIRDFSTLSEKMTPEATFAFINEYLAKLGPPVREYGGFIDKYIGDGIMALFPSDPVSAVRCAIEMQARLVDFNAEREISGQTPIKIGIGMHEGRLMLGAIGDSERMNGTVISDAVNEASRIEGISKQFGIGVVVSERILLGLGDASDFHLRFLGKVAVKGRREEVSVFEIYDGDPEPLRTIKDSIKGYFERGLNAFYAQEYDKALEFFQRVLVDLPEDQASYHYIRIIRKVRAG